VNLNGDTETRDGGGHEYVLNRSSVRVGHPLIEAKAIATFGATEEIGEPVSVRQC
jgi:hypothetical protein